MNIIPGKNDIVLDLVVDGEQRSDIKKVVHFSLGDSTLKGFRLQQLHWWYDLEIKMSETLEGSSRENGPLVRPENAWSKVKILEFMFLPSCLVLPCNFVLILS